jgi:hypothetical protein
MGGRASRSLSLSSRCARARNLVFVNEIHCMKSLSPVEIVRESLYAGLLLVVVHRMDPLMTLAEAVTDPLLWVRGCQRDR